MHELDVKVDEVLTHYGIKGMRWGVIRDRDQPGGADGNKETSKKKTSKKESKEDNKKSSKLENNKSFSKFAREKVKQGRILREQLDFDRVSMKTGEYTHNGKIAKTARVVDRVLDTAKVVSLASGVVMATAAL